VHIYSRVETSVELELPFPLANRGRTRMGEEDNDHESDEVIVFLLVKGRFRHYHRILRRVLALIVMTCGENCP